MRFRLCQATVIFVSRMNFKDYARRVSILLGLLALHVCLPGFSFAQAKRIVTVQVDGLPYAVVDRFVKERDPRTGKSQLPWIDYIFYQRGARLANFYVRGLSLSVP